MSPWLNGSVPMPKTSWNWLAQRRRGPQAELGVEPQGPSEAAQVLVEDVAEGHRSHSIG